MILKKILIISAILLILLINLSLLQAKTREEWFKEGNLLAEQGKYEEAIECYDKALKIDRDYLEAWLEKGRVFNSFGKYEEAMECFEKILEIVPYNGETWNMSGEVYLEGGKYEDALFCSKKAIARDVDNALFWETRGRILYKWGEYEELTSELKEEKNLNYNKKYEEALKYFERALEYNPGYFKAWYGKGMALYKLEKYEEALICADKCLEMKPEKSDTWVIKGNLFIEKNRVEKAIECYDKALELNPCNINALKYKASLLTAMRYYREAIACYDRTLEIDPKNIEALGIKGTIHSTVLNEHEQGMACFDKLLEDYNDWAILWYFKGYCLSGLSKYKEAIECYDKALELEPDYPEAIEGKKECKKLAAKEEEDNSQNKENVLMDYNTLEIYISNQPYKGRKFLHEDGKIYTAIEDLSKSLNFNYDYDREGDILNVEGEKYIYGHILRNEKVIYVPLTTMSLYLGYEVNYSEEVNILDISEGGVLTLNTPGGSSGADNLIVPGRKVGQFYLGQKSSEIVEILGSPLAQGPADELNMVIWDYPGLSFFVDKETLLIRSIIATSPAYETSSGIKVGSTSQEVTGSFNGEWKTNEGRMGYFCYDQGIAFSFGSSDRVEYIIVSRE